MKVPVVTAAEAAALDAACIARGTPSLVLMQRAGRAAAAEIVHAHRDVMEKGVAIFAGPGNNGGDAWVVARELTERGIVVRLQECGAPRTPDATSEKQRALDCAQFQPIQGNERIVVDGLLGTGSSGAPRGAIAEAVARIARMRSDGAQVIALDLPSGLNATTGATVDGVRADTTLSFGSAKRGQLINRSVCGRIVILDIGLGALTDELLPRLVDADWVMQQIPAIAADAHKGSRGRIAIVGGERGMAGAVCFAAEGAMRSGVGLVRLVVPSASVAVVQAVAPGALAMDWPATPEIARTMIGEWADAIVIGPGLGVTDTAVRMLEVVGRSGTTPIVIDANALNICAGDVERLHTIAAWRKTVITPHAAEMGRIAGIGAAEVMARRFEVARDIASKSGAVVLLKGVPSIIAEPDGRTLVSAAGSPVLATGGSGDILAGILTTLLAQMDDAFVATACAAWIHGKAGELAANGQRVRGRTLHDVLHALSDVWSINAAVSRESVLAELALPAQ